ncbi:ATP synthase E chain-domain-containing protein, partial [Phycomyces nitens]
VGRWSALAFGLVYGYTHNASLKSQQVQLDKEADYHRKELLIEQARAAYAKKQLAPTPVKAVENVDIDSPDFDFEKFVADFEAKEKN